MLELRRRIWRLGLAQPLGLGLGVRLGRLGLGLGWLALARFLGLGPVLV